METNEDDTLSNDMNDLEDDNFESHSETADTIDELTTLLPKAVETLLEAGQLDTYMKFHKLIA